MQPDMAMRGALHLTECDERTPKWKSRRAKVTTVTRAALCIGIAVGIAAAAPRMVEAQQPRDTSVTLVLDVGSAEENQLRYLQTLGEVPLSQWAVRGFGPREIAALVARDSGGEAPIAPLTSVRRWGALEWQRSPVVANVWYNSGFAFGNNDGAVWRGRGATVALSAGITGRWGPLTVQLQPMVFQAENRTFALMPHTDTVASAFADPMRPANIDRPQRFGDGAYGHLDPGQSTVRLDVAGVTAGFSTANMWWGPMSEWPFMLSNNAAGIPHVFFGSAAPIDVWIGKVHGRILYGRLEQSDWATPRAGVPGSQFVSGVVASFRPRGITGLEIGAARLFEISWPEGGPGRKELLKPLESFLKKYLEGDPDRIENSSSDNQLASAFLRWVLPESGFEIYAEIGREDHSWDSRDFLLEPEHQTTGGLGMRKAWRRSDGGMSGVTVELFDMDPPLLNRHRAQDGKYSHHIGATQGHTNRGQVLGAGFAAVNGSGARFAWEKYDAEGETLALSLSRMVVRQRARTAGPVNGVDVQYVLGADRTTRVGALDVKYGLSGVYELNRYLTDDATNLQAGVELRW